MVPESLATIRTYGTDEDAYIDLRLLHDAGVVGYVQVSGHGRGGTGLPALRVPESDVARAEEILGPPSELTAHGEDAPSYNCPRCGSARSVALPPYWLIGFVLGVALIGGVMTLQRWRWLSVAVPACAYALHRLEKAPHWRCRSCNQRWNHRVIEEERRAKARRAAPE